MSGSWEWFGNAFSVFGGFLAFLLAFPELIPFKKTKFQIYFAISLLCIGVLQLLNAVVCQGVFSDSAFYVRLTIPLLFAAGPIAYTALTAMVEEDFRFDRKRILLWIPTIVCGLAVFLLPREESVFPWEIASLSNASGAKSLVLFLFLASTVFSFVFGISIFRILASVKEASLRLLIWICALDFASVSLFGALGFLYGVFFLKISSIFVSLALCGIYYARKRYSNLEETIHVELVKAKYSRSRLGGLEIEEILARLETMMRTEKFYQDEEVSLAAVAERMSLTTHQLSELINSKLNKSFFVWLNQYRVEEAKKLLAETNKTVLEIAMEVGFNNRSSFNEAFLKLAEKTPVEYRKTAKV
ncbi:helix-turn-helix domain-containing protein [Leptospira yasudae]|uniref:helix-turn-helix domain-containing protein n=1 Tax=Leptospira yasudae TaxID=2202201 RepID=UPI0010917682|nr:AraC family transcriptional regulator [Leptospira yasudae]TGM97046.1 AraC family transcriptional regulator [Leptospira yasudae]